jgi:large subunit ribosomal protein L24e
VARGKELVNDAAQDFEKRRNRPTRYDRESMGTTLRAMSRVQEIKNKREKLHFKHRMKGVKTRDTQRARLEIKNDIEILAPAAAARDKVLDKIVTAAKARAAKKKMSE